MSVEMACLLDIQNEIQAVCVFHRKPSLRAQFLEEKNQNLQLVNCPKSTLESPHGCIYNFVK